mmetsp:Transcript_2506/g.3820  ORF Transcript_2506/g.3820 Transcript_2506/m.3820 type:complete len:81 (+) Transcript_2506:347-589(+)
MTSNKALGEENEGGFFLDRKSQPKFLWGTWTSNTHEEEDKLYEKLNEIAARNEPGEKLLKQYRYLVATPTTDDDVVVVAK